MMMDRQGRKRGVSRWLPFFFGFSLFFIHFSAALCAGEASGVFGFWLTEGGDGIVEIYPCDSNQVRGPASDRASDQACGRFAWLKEDSDAAPSLDDKNPDPSLRQRRLLGLTFMGGFRQAASAATTYEDGWIYSPRHGSRFSARLTLVAPDSLDLHGYMFAPILGESQIWKRVPKPGKE